MEYSKYELIMKPSMVYENAPEYKFGDSEDVFKFAREILELAHRPEEHVFAVSLNTKMQAVGIFEVGKGGLNGCLADPREVFRTAIMQNAAGIMLMHNHPSGDSAPSDCDIGMTKRMAEAGKIIGIPVVDHVIIAMDGDFSMKSSGYC